MLFELTRQAELDLGTSEPFDFLHSVWKPSHFPSRLEWHSPSVSLRSFRLVSGRCAAVRMTARTIGSGICAAAYAAGPLSAEEVAEVEGRLRAGYGLDLDLGAFYEAVAADKALVTGPIARLRGMRPSRPESMFEILVISLVLQNTTVKRSAGMLDMLLTAFGDEVRLDGRWLAVFCDPRRVAAAQEGFLRETCRLGYRARHLAPIAQAFVTGAVSDDALRALPADEAERILTRLPGVGPYSARVALSQCTGARIPLDAWNRGILSRFLFGRPDAAAEEVAAESERRWGPLQGLAALYVIEDAYLARPASPLEGGS